MDGCSPPRVERLIGIGRACLATLPIAALWLDPSAPRKYVDITYGLMGMYAAYSLLLLLWVQHSALLPARLGLVTHGVDLAIFTLFQYFTEGATSPFFLYFTFALVCATLRWQWRGVLWTAPIALGAFLAMGIVASHILSHRDFEVHRFLIRGVYLAVIAGLLGYLGAYQERRQTEMSSLAAWPTVPPQEPATMVREMLGRAAHMLAAPRVLMAWAEPEEPYQHLAWCDRGDFQWTRESPATFEPLVAVRLAGDAFLCPDLQSPSPIVLHRSSAGLRHWKGPPLHPGLSTRFSVRAVLSVPLRGSCAGGRLFFLDKRAMTSDDLTLGGMVARQVVSSLDHISLDQRAQRVALTADRLRLARDLHDGLLQALAGTALQVEAARRHLGERPKAAEDLLREVQAALAAGQRDLRFLIEELRPAFPGGPGTEFNLHALLQGLCTRVERQWGLRVEAVVEEAARRIPRPINEQVYRIIHEALANAARHAQASTVRVTVGADHEGVLITVADNGRGFPFRGVYDLPALNRMGVGPVSLRERVGVLGGSLRIESRDAGATLEIGLPLHGAGV